MVLAGFVERLGRAARALPPKRPSRAGGWMAARIGTAPDFDDVDEEMADPFEGADKPA